MMKAILFALVLAITIPAGFFSPTPLDSLTMNLNIPDSPRGQQHGYPGYDPAWGEEEDVVTDPTMTTPGRLSENKVLKKIMQGWGELKELEKSGKYSQGDFVPDEVCLAIIPACSISWPFHIGSCVVFPGKKGIINCIKNKFEARCVPCTCYFLSQIGINCPDQEEDEEGVIPTNISDPREQEGTNRPLKINLWNRLDEDIISVAQFNEFCTPRHDSIHIRKNKKKYFKVDMINVRCNTEVIGVVSEHYDCGTTEPGKARSFQVQYNEKEKNCEVIPKEQGEEEDVVTDPTMNTTAPDYPINGTRRKQEGQEEDNDVTCEGIDPADIAGVGWDCPRAKAEECAIKIGETVAECIALCDLDPALIFACVKKVYDTGDYCYQCICAVMEKLDVPCPPQVP